MSKLKGKLTTIPVEIAELMLMREKEEFIKDHGSSEKMRESYLEQSLTGGFTFIDTPEGFEFWDNIVRLSNFEIFYYKYPKGISFNKLHYERV